MPVPEIVTGRVEVTKKFDRERNFLLNDLFESIAVDLRPVHFLDEPEVVQLELWEIPAGNNFRRGEEIPLEQLVADV